MALEGRRVIVTGASSGVGRHLATMLHAEGAAVCLVGRSLQKLAELRATLKPAPETHAADFDDPEAVGNLGRRLADQRVDALIHSAGVIYQAPVQQAAMEDFDRQYRVNVRAPYQLTQLLLPRLIDAQGTVIFINSSTAVAAGAGVSQYAATKHAAKAVADSLRAEVNTLGVRVVSLYLGKTATPLQQRLHELANRHFTPEAMIQPEAIGKVVLDVLEIHPSAEITDLHIRPMKKS